jgi:hypothetical protein
MSGEGSKLRSKMLIDYLFLCSFIKFVYSTAISTVIMVVLEGFERRSGKTRA